MKKTVIILSLILLFLFAGITVVGVYMTYKEISASKEKKDNVTEKSDVKLDVKESFSFELTNATPGLIITFIGAFLFALMLRNVPLKEVLGCQTKGSGHGDFTGFMVTEKILSKQIIKVPLPVWWLLKPSKKLVKVESYSTDENTKLVIKSIGTAENGFINFSEIVNDTNLNLKTINKALDWLVINKLATENKGRRDKVYELTPKGRNLFNTIEESRKAYYKHIKESNEAMPDRESSQFDDIP